ncbi:hypothetical protein Cni_G10511 [Canna indica]|uniref:Uncharacterized protein n=1 Tax=Canna indica TaxID=4628 RepID=A0AAQ3K475_9LILI|nr:hypothetical protein Cni_G10511 [Canna indica]
MIKNREEEMIMGGNSQNVMIFNSPLNNKEKFNRKDEGLLMAENKVDVTMGNDAVGNYSNVNLSNHFSDSKFHRQGKESTKNLKEFSSTCSVPIQIKINAGSDLQKLH